MECYENVMGKYFKSSMKELFPSDTKNKFLVYLTGIVHLIGALYIKYGFLTPPKYIHIYVIYLISIIMSYFILDEKCFMNDIVLKLQNKQHSKSLKAGSRDEEKCMDSKMTHLKMSTIYKFISLYLLISTISLIDKRFHPVTILKTIYSNCEKNDTIYQYLPLMMLYGYLTFYGLLSLFK